MTTTFVPANEWNGLMIFVFFLERQRNSLFKHLIETMESHLIGHCGPSDSFHSEYISHSLCLFRTYIRLLHTAKYHVEKTQSCSSCHTKLQCSIEHFGNNIMWKSPTQEAVEETY